MTLADANPQPQVTGSDELSGKVNYFIGNDPKQWRTSIPTYAKVKYEGVYPGIDLVYYGNQRQLEYDFIVTPGADPTTIILGFEGAETLEIDAQGDLVLHTAGGSLRQCKPLVYQEVGGVRQEIAGGYVLKGRDQVGFQVAAYDASRPLVIDPVLLYSTYLGGSGADAGFGIAVDATGNVYVTGGTTSTNFPTAGPLQANFGGIQDVFVTKLNASGSALVYSTYLGGNSSDFGREIAVDATGNAYVTGSTSSTNFPTANPLQGTSGGGSRDIFVTKLNASGSALVFSTYLGGSGDDVGIGIVVDATSNAYVTGSTSSLNFPTTNPLQPTFGGGSEDVFVTKLNASGSALVFSTYLGGSNGDISWSIAVDATGNAYVTGSTSSTNFPTANPLQGTPGGESDAFVTKLNASGSALVFSTYLGGSGIDGGITITVDATDNAYVTGYTSSINFPSTANAFDTNLNGNTDLFMVKIDPIGSALVFSTYLGGSGAELPSTSFFGYDQGIAVDAAGNAYVTGETPSTDFPTVDPIQATFGGGDRDAFVAKLNATGSALVYSTYLGGSRSDVGRDIAIDAAGNVYITGATTSTDFPVESPLQPSFGSALPFLADAFVAKIGSPHDVAITAVTSNLPLPNPNTPLQLSATVTNTGSVDIASVQVRLFLDLNANLTLDSGEPSVLKTVTTLLVGTSQTVVGVFSTPPAGSYVGVAVADPANLLAEANEGNNVGNTSLVITLPDLTVTALSVSASPMPNGNYQVTLEATLANLGSGAASTVQARFAFSTNGGASYTNIGPVSVGMIPAGGTATATKGWNNVQAGTYLIKVTADPNNLVAESEEANNSAVFTVMVGGVPKVLAGSTEQQQGNKLPIRHALEQNAPNPFNPTTQIAYALAQPAHVTLVIYNLLGQEVVRLVDQPQVPGQYVVTWDGRDWRGMVVSSGVYLYRLTTSTGFTQTRRMTLVK